MSDITKQSLTELVENIKNKKLSSTEILDNLDICFIVLRSILICYLNMTQSIT